MEGMIPVCPVCGGPIEWMEHTKERERLRAAALNRLIDAELAKPNWPVLQNNDDTVEPMRRGCELSKEELRGILAVHKEWLDSGHKTGKRAELQGLALENANLYNADLRYADLSKANLQGADLMHANLLGANLDGANLEYAKLKWSIRPNGETDPPYQPSHSGWSFKDEHPCCY